MESVGRCPLRWRHTICQWRPGAQGFSVGSRKDRKGDALSIRWRIMLLVMLAAVVSSLAGLAVTVFNARVAVRTEMRAALAMALAQPAFAGASRHVTRQFIPNGSALPPPPDDHTDVPGWFAALIRTDEPPVLVKVEGGDWLLRPDPADEVSEVWSDASALALTALGVLGLLLLSLHMLVSRALAPLNRFGVALDRMALGLPADLTTDGDAPELSAMARRISALDAGLAMARAENVALSHSLIALQDRERADLARDLHDELGPLLFGIRVDAHAITNAAGRGRLDAAEAAARADSINRSATAIRSLSRRILTRLRPMGLDHLPVATIIQDMIEGLARQHTTIRFQHKLDPAAFGRTEMADLSLYRLAQESLLNAVRHGMPTRVSLTITVNATGIAFCVEDDGVGVAGAPGHGITGMRERVQALGGRLSIERPVNGGTRIGADLPVPAPERVREGTHG